MHPQHRWLLFGLGLVLCACIETRAHFQARYIHEQLEPQRIDRSREVSPPSRIERVLRLRVYADANDRTQSFRWRERVSDQIARSACVCTHAPSVARMCQWTFRRTAPAHGQANALPSSTQATSGTPPHRPEAQCMWTPV